MFFQVKPGRSGPSGTGWTPWGWTLESTTSTREDTHSSPRPGATQQMMNSHMWRTRLLQGHRWRPGDLPAVREDQGAGGLGQSQQASLLQTGQQHEEGTAAEFKCVCDGRTQTGHTPKNCYYRKHAFHRKLHDVCAVFELFQIFLELSHLLQVIVILFTAPLWPFCIALWKINVLNQTGTFTLSHIKLQNKSLGRTEKGRKKV